MSNPAAGAAADCDEATCLHALELISASAVAMTVKVAIELGLIDALSMATGRAMTADELSAPLPAADKAEAAASVDRLLRFLACYNAVKCSTETSPSGELLRRYTAAPVCRWLTSNSSEGSLAPLAMFAVDEDYLPSWNHLGAAVAAGGPAAFERAYGVPMFQYMGTNTRLNRVFNKAMAQQTMMVIGKLLERFKGFAGISVLVDVGGGTGATLEMITSQYKHIRGINFDLPHALSEAPAIPGVQHVPGNMFEEVPYGDAIFLKSILHLQNDDDCIKILSNCHRALPEHGKVIAMEIVLPAIPEATPMAQNPFRFDVIMLNNFRGGKERTEQEFAKLARDSGFDGEFRSTYIFANYWALEFSK
ncbi:putative inactive methyltransferase [Panicum miliaceum]|uniref:Inactive methyltransferase n=1 Tax=Panicum miliaceum TaxID=4540 RepID=A0A3L6Q9Q5_PANMI|nr:putative inactive methyltransferase [Panicum miliaceum]